MELNLKKVAEFMRKAEDEDLLDRVTLYRDQMSRRQLDLFENELSRRGYHREEIAAHDADFRSDAIENKDGTVVRCSFCSRPPCGRRAAGTPLGKIPLFPRFFAYCRNHAPAPEPTAR